MSDQSKYINTYIEHSIGMIHEYVSLVLQARTQAKLANDIVAEKDATISFLDEQVQTFKSELEKNRNELNQTVTTSNEQINRSRADASKWEHEYNSIKAKAEHTDTLVAQINEMKQMVITKNKEIEDLKKQIENLTKPAPVKTPSPKKVINIEDKRDKSIVMKEPEPDKNDDF
jgi:chromosome segregation ATPase